MSQMTFVPGFVGAGHICQWCLPESTIMLLHIIALLCPQPTSQKQFQITAFKIYKRLITQALTATMFLNFIHICLCTKLQRFDLQVNRKE